MLTITITYDKKYCGLQVYEQKSIRIRSPVRPPSHVRTASDVEIRGSNMIYLLPDTALIHNQRG